MNMFAEYDGKLAENLKFGHILEIGAEAENEASWFSISLAAASQENDLVQLGLHMMVYMDKESIVFKQQLNGVWLNVAREEFNTSLFRLPFKVNIFMSEEKFHIAINKESLIFIKYGMPLRALNTLKIVGHLKSIHQIDHRKCYPHVWPPIQMSEKRLQFSHDLPVKFQPGHVMVLKMHLLGKKDGRFHMHFRNAWNCKRQEVHISFRFDTKLIVRTSKLPTKAYTLNPDIMDFGPEERDGEFPFEIWPRPFKLAITFTSDSLKVAKDGKFLFEYVLRSANVLSDLSGVKIFGMLGMVVRVSAIDHYRLDDALGEGFERYSNI